MFVLADREADNTRPIATTPLQPSKKMKYTSEPPDRPFSRLEGLPIATTGQSGELELVKSALAASGSC